MSAALPVTSILKTELTRQNIILSQASVSQKLSVFSITIKRIIDFLNSHAPREFTEISLQVLEDDLITINQELWEVRHSHNGAKAAIKPVRKAKNIISAFIKVIEKAEENDEISTYNELFDYLDDCVDFLSDAYEYLIS